METHSEDSAVQDKNKKLMIKLAFVAVGMLLFGVIVLPKLYTLACSLTGVNINPDNNSGIAVGAVTRGVGDEITVSFQSRVLDDLPVRFYAKNKQAKIKAGQTGFNTFYFENLSDKIVYLRPIHTVSPSFAAASFDMMVCFCFNDQALEPGEKKEYEIQYSFATDLDQRVDRAIVRYDLHKIEKERMKPFQVGPEALDPDKVEEIMRSQADD